jgi:hypothetical protein
MEAANDPNAQVPPPHVNGQHPADPENNSSALYSARIAAPRPAADEHLAMVSPRSGGAPAGSDEPPAHRVPDAEPPAQQHPDFAALAEQERRTLISNDPDASLLHIQAGALPRENAQAFDRNLAEIVAFTDSPNQAANRTELRKQLLGALEKSLEGPQIRTRDGLTEFPVLPQYVGENVAGFDNWKTRNPNDAPVAKYQSNLTKTQVKYYTPLEQENARVYVGANKKLVLANGEVPDGTWMFVVDQDGHMIARPFPSAADFIHHSSLAAGKPVLMAGQFLARKGEIVNIQNQSGHYRPDAASFKRFLVALGAQGVELNTTAAPPLKYITTAGGGFKVVPDNTRNLLKEPDVVNAAPIRTLLSSMKPTAEVQAQINLRAQQPDAQPARLPRAPRGAQPEAQPGAQRVNHADPGDEENLYQDDATNPGPANPNLGAQQPDAVPEHHAGPDERVNPYNDDATNPERANPNLGAQQPPDAASPSHPHAVEDQPLTWELPPQLQGLDGFWADDTAPSRGWAA